MSTEKLLKTVRKKLNEADAIVVGAGAGLSASAGLDYVNKTYFYSHYHPFVSKGYETIWDGITDNWYLTKENARTYWGYWSHHINTIFHQAPQLDTYKALFDLIRQKPYFIITTNGDGQFFKGPFDSNRIFAMQGSYGYFQCQKGCHDSLYDNQTMIESMVNNRDATTLQIREEDIPYCPKCGELLCPNLRIDHYFVEKQHMVNKDAYVSFINELYHKKVVFLELGVGFNTPVIIRYPFERMVEGMEHATLVRVNQSKSPGPEMDQKRFIEVQMDIDAFIKKVQEEETK